MKPDQGPALIALEDGWHARGRLVGAAGSATGEFVFNTCMSGYQEVLTDPSYARQIVVMTYPLIGNYGIAADDGESPRPQVAGFVMRTCVREPSSWRSVETLPEYLNRHGVVAVDGVDTRALTLHLRERGALRGVVTSEFEDVDEAVDRARSIPVMEGLDLATLVMPAVASEEGSGTLVVAALDLGMKQNIVRRLAAEGCRVVRLPGQASAEEVLAARPDGVFVSNGPGDPAAVRGAIRTLGELSKRAPELPTFGICLGQQLLALAHGGETYKLKFGHHGGNHPVQDLRTGEIDITSHNHGFAVREDKDGERRVVAGAPALEVTHVNLYDGTVEGFAHRERPLFAVQYHPEAAPGPHDALHHLRSFVAAMRERP
ncbi:MAG: glutamine-hydrolyzing carbamoyl-phosphate synthase small subunit [Gemmatimonadota bacterium]